jgi:hypothetical protein
MMLSIDIVYDLKEMLIPDRLRFCSAEISTRQNVAEHQLLYKKSF